MRNFTTAVKAVLIFQLVFAPVVSAAEVTATIPGLYGKTALVEISSNALPQVRSIIQGVSDIEKVSNTKMVVKQDEKNAIIDWETFNIGENAWVYFNQEGNTNWAALNRIYDANPSQIYGKLTADGKVYLINQNGIYFGEGATVNVYSLTASSLNLYDDDFLNSTYEYHFENYQENDDFSDSSGAVVNLGEVETEYGGSVFLLGTDVGNYGTITTEGGQTALAAGDEIEVFPDDTTGTSRTALVVNVMTEGAGTATNYNSGEIYTDGGTAGMYGKIVNQKGLIRAVTAIQTDGRIELFASDRITTGKGSETSTPVSESTETVHESFEFSGGTIILAGLDEDTPENPQTTVDVVNHQGTLSAPSGQITINAGTRVLLGGDSVIDVSGSEIELTAQDLLAEIQLNSVELADEEAQKDGILQGETITFNTLTGSSIGNVSGALSSEEKTALEQSLDGGTVVIEVADGDIIAKEGSLIDFSGGAAHYEVGYVETTKLVADGEVYDISEAPSDLTYDAVLEPGELTVGGSEYIPEHYRGGDGGSATLVARTLVLEGDLDGSVTVGLFQDQVEELTNEYGNTITDGRAMPEGSMLTIGVLDSGNDAAVIDHVVDSVAIVSGALSILPEGFSWDDSMDEDDDTTYLSDDMLSASGVGTLNIYTNTSFETDAGSHVELEAGGTLNVIARSIYHQGEIVIPSGAITLKTNENATSALGLEEEYVEMTERIYLESGSLLSTAGEQADNSDGGVLSGEENENPQIDGGSITIKDLNANGDGVFIQTGATVDVSGGYEIDADGDVTGGDAGELTIQGQSILLNGDLLGLSLEGSAGGSISLHASNVLITQSYRYYATDFDVDDVVPDTIDDIMILGADMFEETGFANIEIKSLNDIEIVDNAVLSTSYRKLADPVSAGGSAYDGSGADFSSSVTYENKDDYLLLLADSVGDTSISLTAGALLDDSIEGGSLPRSDSARIEIGTGSVVATSTGGSVSISATEVTVNGTIETLAGDIDIDAGTGGLTIGADSMVLAQGTVRIDTENTADGMPVKAAALDGGTVTLSSDGDLVVEDGAIIDVSSATPVDTYLVESDGSITEYTQTSAAGTLNLTFADTLVLEGDLYARNYSDTNAGGTFTLLKTNGDESLDLSGDLIAYLSRVGFDDLYFGSWGTILFTSSVEAAAGRHLTLDAPEIAAADDVDVDIRSSWITLTNTTDKYSSSNIADNYIVEDAAAGSASLALTAEWTDIDGPIVLSGYDDVVISAYQDIRLSDNSYTISTGSTWIGSLTTSGDLSLKAERIYPETDVDFSITAGGSVSIYGYDNDADAIPVSAGGSLTITAADIYHAGALYAPLGSISLITGEDGRIFLEDGSLISVSSDSSMYYGTAEEETYSILDKETNEEVEVSEAPGKTVTISGGEVVVDSGAVIDAEGGGGVFSYYFLSGIEGTDNPLEASNTWVILPDNSIEYPGASVYISGDPDLEDGYYTLLPADEYAFVEGAMVITLVEENVAVDTDRVTSEGYDVVFGYETDNGVEIENAVISAYSIRSAEDVLAEGNFTVTEIAADSGGSVSITATTAVVAGTILGSGLDGADSGTLTAIAENIEIGSGAWGSADLNWNSDIADELVGIMSLTPDVINDGGFGVVIIGDEEETTSVTLQADTVLEAENIRLAASDSILVESDVVLSADDSLELLVSGGSLTVAEGALLEALGEITLSALYADILGSLSADGGTLNIISENIFLTEEAYEDDDEQGFVVTSSLWETFDTFGNISLTAGSMVNFVGDVTIVVPGTFEIDAPLMSGSLGNGESAEASIQASLVSILNDGDGVTLVGDAVDTFLSISANYVTIGHGDIAFEGFSDIVFDAGSGIAFLGNGTLTADADLTFETPVLTAGYYAADEGDIESSCFTVNAGSGVLSILGNGGVDGLGDTLTGNLELTATAVAVDTLIDVGGGSLAINAVGQEATDGIVVGENAVLRAVGNAYFDGGAILLAAENGDIEVASGALLDVSGGESDGAGEIELVASNGTVLLDGSILGIGADSGTGGSIAIVSQEMAALSSVLGKIEAGGFDAGIDIRFTTGDIAIGEETTLSAGEITLSADTGSIYISGVLNAVTGESGTSVSVYAGEDLYLYSGAVINATGTEASADGGEVLLSAVDGWLYFESGAKINVAAASSEGDDGLVTFRAQREGTGIRMTLEGEVAGARQATVEANRIYSGVDSIYWTESQDSGGAASVYMDALIAEADEFIDNLTFTSALMGIDSDSVVVAPSIEIESDGDLLVATDLDLSDYRFGEDDDVAGALVLRAAGDLEIAGDIVDANHTYKQIESGATDVDDTWRLQLVAGADMTAADDHAIDSDEGDLILDDDVVVYTENASLYFASGGDTAIGTAVSQKYMIKSDMRYNLGTYYGEIIGNVGGTLTISGGVIQSALGDIDLTVGEDLYLLSEGGYVGSIRTTGEVAEGYEKTAYWEYQNGGDISLKVGGDVTANLSGHDAWDYDHSGTRDSAYWSASYGSSATTYVTEGIAAMACGSITVETGGDFFSQIGTFGEGDLSITAGGDVDGRFLVYDGEADIDAGGNFGSRLDDVAIELFNAQVDITAQGDILVGAITTPTLVRDYLSTDKLSVGYTEETSVSLTAINGDITLSCVDAYNETTSSAALVLPGNIIFQAGGSIYLTNQFAMVPSTNGTLQLIAGVDIDGSYCKSSGASTSALINMSDMDPSEIYGVTLSESDLDELFSESSHADSPVHENDDEAVMISAGNDIKNIQLSLPKKAVITAGNDISNIYYAGQNINEEDVTYITAGNSISFTSTVNSSTAKMGIVHSGPGVLYIQAGESINLGLSDGITTMGNTLNSALSEEGSTLMLVSGYTLDLTAAEAEDFFESIREYGLAYSELLADGDLEAAEALVAEARETLIDPLLSQNVTGTGDIDMTNSEIASSGEDGDIFIFAAGDLNVGRSTISSDDSDSENSGIYTESGGDINIFTVGDININESRTMTFYGGDITMWTDAGDINAGRGSKTAISTPEVKYTVNDDGSITRTFTPPAVGSGIRTLTYDPDGEAGPLVVANIGDVYLFAPSGEIDAGEAGIAGGDIILGATEIVNVQNIEVGGSSVGVPDVSDAGSSLGALSGAGGVTETSSISESTALAGNVQDRFSQYVEELSDSLVPKWLAVEVLGFVEDDEDEEDEADDTKEESRDGEEQARSGAAGGERTPVS